MDQVAVKKSLGDNQPWSTLNKAPKIETQNKKAGGKDALF